MKNKLPSDFQSFHLRISGKVQGVFFRASAKRKADALGVRGWIRNTEDDGVESKVSGEVAAVSEFIEWCKKGPALAVVTEVLVEPCADPPMDKFTILDTHGEDKMPAST